METLRKQLASALTASLTDLNPVFKDVKVEVDYPAIGQFGDYTSNIALKAAKILKISPQSVAEELILKLKNLKGLNGIFEKIETAGPGFINFYLSQAYLSAQADKILSLKGAYGQLKPRGKAKKIQLEFISANPTGPLTIGNGRGGFFGDVLGNVFKQCGYGVVKEYLINDAGKQIEVLGHSVLQDEQALYKGDYITELHKRLQKFNGPAKVGARAAKIILVELLKATIEQGMRVRFDRWFSETKELRKTKKIEKVIAWLKKKNYLYQSEGAWWFKATERGDTRDRVLVKGNGEFTYLANDCAYLVNKFSERKFDRVINIWGADHHGDVPGLLAAAEALGYKGRQEIILMQFVRLFKEGKEVRMSKRLGTYITMDELLKEVGHDAARFLFLMYSNNTHIDFDLNAAKEKSEKNPVYYVQYAYARLSGILKQEAIAKGKQGKIKALAYGNGQELALIKSLLRYPEVLEEIIIGYQVQRLPQLALEIAEKFHDFYNHCRVIDRDKVDWQRVALVKLTRKVLGEVLAVIGVAAPEKM
ncbi:MAG: arginine--tRNA ligase [Candidatus Komeilibacteria bacterium]|nr:arginine--tRNA ligase [Candidatus Komeilibacteria bacterium]